MRANFFLDFVPGVSRFHAEGRPVSTSSLSGVIVALSISESMTACTGSSAGQWHHRLTESIRPRCDDAVRFLVNILESDPGACDRAAAREHSADGSPLILIANDGAVF